MITRYSKPTTDERPERTRWAALWYIRESGTWGRLSSHKSPLAAARACVRAFQERWRDIDERARSLRALAEHPAVARFSADGLDGAMLARWARELSQAIEYENENVDRLLDEPNSDDQVQLNRKYQGADISAATAEATDAGENARMDPGKYDFEVFAEALEALRAANPAEVEMLYRVLDVPLAELPVAFLELAVDISMPVETMVRAWEKPLAAFMRIAYRVRAAVAALHRQPVGSYLDFCTDIVADGPDTESAALQLLSRCKPDDMVWSDYLARLVAKAGNLAKSRSDVVHFGDHRTRTLGPETLRHVQGVIDLMYQQQHQIADGESNVVITLIFLNMELAQEDRTLPQEVADELYIRAARDAVLRIFQHHGSLISPSAIERGSHAARKALRGLTELADAVRASSEHTADVIPFEAAILDDDDGNDDVDNGDDDLETATAEFEPVPESACADANDNDDPDDGGVP